MIVHRISISARRKVNVWSSQSLTSVPLCTDQTQGNHFRPESPEIVDAVRAGSHPESAVLPVLRPVGCSRSPTGNRP